MRRLVLRTTEISALGRSSANEGNIGLELSTVQQWISAIPDTGRVVVVLVIVGECTPFGTSVDDTIAKYQSTGTTDCVTSRKVFHDVRRIFLAFSTHQVQSEIFHPRLLRFHSYCSTGKGRYGHDMHRRIRHLAQSSTFPGSSARLLVKRGRIELLIAMTDEEWGIQLGGVFDRRPKTVPAGSPLSNEPPGVKDRLGHAATVSTASVSNMWLTAMTDAAKHQPSLPIQMRNRSSCQIQATWSVFSRRADKQRGNAEGSKNYL